jgi:hypothetical protein
VSTAGLGEVAKVKHLPPTLMAQYYFGDANSKVRPYVGPVSTTPPSSTRKGAVPWPGRM